MDMPRVDVFDSSMLEFARRWLPFGGPRAGDILVEFGMTITQYELRLLVLIDSTDSRTMPEADRARLRAQLVERHPNRRLHLAQP